MKVLSVCLYKIANLSRNVEYLNFGSLVNVFKRKACCQIVRCSVVVFCSGVLFSYIVLKLLCYVREISRNGRAGNITRITCTACRISDCKCICCSFTVNIVKRCARCMLISVSYNNLECINSTSRCTLIYSNDRNYTCIYNLH